MRYILLVNQGVLRMQHGKLDQAATDLQAAIRLNDRLSQAYETTGDRLSQARQVGRGRRTVRTGDRTQMESGLAAPLSPAVEPTSISRARIRLRPSGRAALGDLDQAIRLEKPGNQVLARDQTNRGRLLALDHRDDDALTAWDAALAAVHDYPEAHRLRLDLLFKRKRYDAVIRSCDALIARGKATPQIYELRGLARTEAE